MNNVSTTAIMGAFAVVIAALIASFGMNHYLANKRNTAEMVQASVKVNDKIQDDEFLKYDNMTVDGAAVIRAIKLLRNETISIQVRNGHGGYDAYIYKTTPDPFTADTTYVDVGSQISKDDNDKFYKEAKMLSLGSNRYIEQSDKYHSRVIYSRDGSISAIVFEK